MTAQYARCRLEAGSRVEGEEVAAILLGMWQDTGEERQRLAAAYAEKYDDELRELAADYQNLTDVARQTLRDEMKKRGLGDPEAKPDMAQSVAATRSSSDPPAAVHWEPQRHRYDAADETAEDEETPLEYTWKTELCTCATKEQAAQLGEALRRAGIDSWVEGGGVYAWDAGGPKMYVAADQLEQAKAIAAQPIPQEILEDLKAQEAPQEFEAPKCPACGAEDPVLVSVDPDNTWECESCGKEWTSAP